MSTFGNFEVSGTSVTGTANKVTEYNDFSSDPNEQEGYYLPVDIEPWEGVQVRSSRNPERWTKLKDDGTVVIFLGKEAPNQVEWYETKDAHDVVTRYSVNVGAAAAAAYAAARRSTKVAAKATAKTTKKTATTKGQ